MLNYIEGSWRESAATERIPVINPATLEEIGRTPLSPASEVDQAAVAAAKAFPAWRRTPVTERVQYLFKLKGLLENEFEDISRTITVECGKTLAEARGEMRRAIENVEVACGTPILIIKHLDFTVAHAHEGICPRDRRYEILHVEDG